MNKAHLNSNFECTLQITKFKDIYYWLGVIAVKLYSYGLIIKKQYYISLCSITNK